MLSHDVTIGDHSFVAGRAVIGGRAHIGINCVIGLNSTVCNRIRIAPRCFIAAGAVVTADTEPDGIYRAHQRAGRPCRSLD